MFKIYLIVIMAGLAGSAYFLLQPPAVSPGSCAFCDVKVLEAQKFYEDELVIALYTHKPILPGHCLVLPKRHVARFEELSPDELVHLGQTIKKVNQAARQVFKTDSYFLLQKNGREVGQTVPHVHFHYVPRLAREKSTLSLILKIYLNRFKQPLPSATMQTMVAKMQAAMKQEPENKQQDNK